MTFPHLVYLLSSISVAILLAEKQRHFFLCNLIATYRLFCRFSILLNLDQKKKSVERQPKLPNRLLWLRQPPDGFLSGLQMSYDSSLPQWSPVTDVAPSFQLFCWSISTCFQAVHARLGEIPEGRPSFPGVSASWSYSHWRHQYWVQMLPPFP